MGACQRWKWLPVFDWPVDLKRFGYSTYDNKKVSLYKDIKKYHTQIGWRVDDSAVKTNQKDFTLLRGRIQGNRQIALPEFEIQLGIGFYAISMGVTDYQAHCRAAQGTDEERWKKPSVKLWNLLESNVWPVTSFVLSTYA